MRLQISNGMFNLNLGDNSIGFGVTITSGYGDLPMRIGEAKELHEMLGWLIEHAERANRESQQGIRQLS